MSPQKLRLYILAGLFAVLCWIFLSPSPIPFDIEIQRELGFVGHVCAFAVVTLALCIIITKPQHPIVFYMIAAAISLETAQIFIPTRGADIMDFAMNCLGIVIGLLLYRLLGAFFSTSEVLDQQG